MQISFDFVKSQIMLDYFSSTYRRCCNVENFRPIFDETATYLRSQRLVQYFDQSSTSMRGRCDVENYVKNFDVVAKSK